MNIWVRVISDDNDKLWAGQMPTVPRVTDFIDVRNARWRVTSVIWDLARTSWVDIIVELT